MDRKPPWGMVFSVAAMIVALSVAGYALVKVSASRAGVVPSAGSSPSVLIEWKAQYGASAIGRVVNISGVPLVVRRVDYLRPEAVERNGLQVGIQEGRPTRSFHADRTANVLQPGEWFGFTLIHHPSPLPSRVTVFGDNDIRLQYEERLAPD